jgi:hypothetical protein
MHSKHPNSATHPAKGKLGRVSARDFISASAGLKQKIKKEDRVKEIAARIFGNEERFCVLGHGDHVSRAMRSRCCLYPSYRY